MKKLLFLLTAAVALLAAAPGARAFENDPWHYSAKALRELLPRMEAVDAKRDTWGASPRMRDEITELHERLAALNEHVRRRLGNPRVAKEKADELGALMSEVETEFQDHIRHYEDAEHEQRSWRDW